MDTGNDNHGSVKGGMTGAATFCFYLRGDE